MDPNNQEEASLRPKSVSPPSASYPPFQMQFPEGQWSTGLYDCCDDPSNCLFTWCCPCVAMGQIAEIIDGGTTSCKVAGLIYVALGFGWRWLYACSYRSKLRGLFSLPEAPCSDCLVHCCCCVCALTQEYRELKNRGADPSIGWQGNVEKWKRDGVKVPPIVAPGMAR